MNTFNDNPVLSTDSYKASHFLQYPPEMRGMFSYVESRGGRYDHVLFFGLRAILRRYLECPITMEQVEEANEFFTAHGEPFPLAGWQKVVNVYGGIVPLVIRAVPEGTVVPIHNVLMTVECTDPELFWLVSWFETLLMRVWYPITVATQSMYAKKAILEALQLTADDPEAEIAFKLHDFGARGVSSGESAAIGGAAHLVNFMGSDTVEGVVLANKVYGAGMAGFSIPAAEHSTITSWGPEREVEAYRNILNQFAKEGAIVAAVSDSYNLWDAIEHLWGSELREQVVSSGATIVIRPDSGIPHEVVLRALQMLDAKFGHTINGKGFKVLNHVRVIQGDGITPDTIPFILEHAIAAGYSASNIAFGMGGGLLQLINRDTQRFAYKCSAILTTSGWVGVNKDPITDPDKASKAGRLTLYREDGVYRTGLASEGWVDAKIDALETVYSSGILPKANDFDAIRDLARSGLDQLMK